MPTPENVVEVKQQVVVFARVGRGDGVGVRSPDLIIADIGMTEQDGYTLIRQIREMPGAHGRTPAIALSAFARPEDRQSAGEAGFTQFIAKPASPQDLLRAVPKLVVATQKAG